MLNAAHKSRWQLIKAGDHWCQPPLRIEPGCDLAHYGGLGERSSQTYLVEDGNEGKGLRDRARLEPTLPGWEE